MNDSTVGFAPGSTKDDLPEPSHSRTLLERLWAGVMSAEHHKGRIGILQRDLKLRGDTRLPTLAAVLTDLLSGYPRPHVFIAGLLDSVHESEGAFPDGESGAEHAADNRRVFAAQQRKELLDRLSKSQAKTILVLLQTNFGRAIDRALEYETTQQVLRNEESARRLACVREMKRELIEELAVKVAENDRAGEME